MKQIVCNVLRLLVAVHGVLLVHSDCGYHQSLSKHYDRGLPTAESQCSGACTMFEAFMTITVSNVQQVNFICLGSNEEEINRLEKKDLSPAEQTVTTGFGDDADHMGQCHTVDVELVAHPGMSASYNLEQFEACTENNNCEFIMCEGITKSDFQQTLLTTTEESTTQEATTEYLPSQRDCAEHQANGETVSGVYSITTTGPEPHTFDVYCDMDTDDGGWTVFQKRFDGSVDFHRTWTEYQDGFGSLTGEFWLGLDKIAYIVEQGSYELRFDLEDFENDVRNATYDAFSIDRDDYYRLDVGTYSGSAGNSLSNHVGEKFSTYDNDQDSSTGNCAERYLGGWWFNNCHESNLNGEYGGDNYAEGLVWNTFRGLAYSLMRTEIKIRPVGYEP